MNKSNGKHSDDFNVEVLSDSIKFYLLRVEGYLEVIRDIASKYRGMSLIEFDGYFEGKFEPVKYIRAEIHTSDIDGQNMINFANDIRLRLRQKNLAIEFNNRLILISEN